MKYLKIENNKGLYWDGKEYREIDQINKDGLLSLLNSAETDDFEMDPYDENLLGNKAHQVIYENIHSKFEQFAEDKDQFKTDVDKLYKDAISKYGVEDEDLEKEVEEPEEESENDEKEINSDDIPF